MRVGGLGMLKRWLIAMSVMIPIIWVIDTVDNALRLTSGISPKMDETIRLVLLAAIAPPLWAWIIGGGKVGRIRTDRTRDRRRITGPLP
jgi:hypothetical protein